MAKFKELKVGDEVRLDYLDTDHYLYTRTMSRFVGIIGRCVEVSAKDKTVRVLFPDSYIKFYYKPKWLSLVEDVSKEAPEVQPNYTEIKLWGDTVTITWEEVYGKHGGLVLRDGEDVHISNSDGATVGFWKSDLVKLHQAVTEALEIIEEGKGKE